MHTEIIKVDARRPDAEIVRKAAEVLEMGGLIVFPTETVYGIGCVAQRSSVERLNKLKQRSGQKRYTLHIGRKEDVARYAPVRDARVKKLIETGWPGPITIVFELDGSVLCNQRKVFDEEVFNCLYPDNSIGIRCPDSAIASAVLSVCRKPVFVPSANLAGQEPATDIKGVADQLAGSVELVLDGGACAYKKSSTVVKAGAKGWEVLREGAYSIEQIRDMSVVRILFVCTGNTCRSPVAEGLCRKYLSEKLGCGLDELESIGYMVDSAGIAAIGGMGASAESIAFCEKEEVNISSCRSKAISTEMVERSDYIFAMSADHIEHICSVWPDAAKKCRLLTEEEEISDPIGGCQDVYIRCGEMIKQGVLKRVGEFLQ
ncbi:MAG: L-threonylcarbamoyladenylate synthase [Planctomycetota bacterium]